MSKYTPQDMSDERGQTILEYTCREELFLITPFGKKDKMPDIDGTIRLRDGRGNYLNKFLHYQLKTCSKITSARFYCSQNVVEFLLDTNTPTLLLIVDKEKEKVYWYHLTKSEIERIRTYSSSKGITLNLADKEISKQNQEAVNAEWSRIAHETNYEKSIIALSNISQRTVENAKRIIGLLYLLQKGTIDTFAKLTTAILGLREDEFSVIEQEIIREGLIVRTAHYYFVENEKVGRESLVALLNNGLSLEGVEGILGKHDEKILFFRQLSEIPHPKVKSYLEDVGARIYRSIKSESNNENIYEYLEFLKVFSYRIPDIAMCIIRHVIKSRKPERRVKLQQYVITFKNYNPEKREGVILECLEILEMLCYFKTKTALKTILQLYHCKNATVSEAAKGKILKLAEYDLRVLQKIGYKPQQEIVQEIEDWSDKTLLKQFSLVIDICRKLLSPSCEGHSMSDYRTVVFSFGSLRASKNLTDIRERAIFILKKLYKLTSNVNEKIKALGALEEGTRLSHHGKIGSKERSMIKQTAEAVIRFYLSTVSSAENQLVKEIEKQANHLTARYERIAGLKELRSVMNNKIDYQLFKLFVGYDTDYGKPGDWESARKVRQENIRKIIDDICEDNLGDWKSKLLSVAKEYSHSKVGEFGYFRYFLRQLGEIKPKVVLKLLSANDRVLQPFRSDMLSGIWFSEKKDVAKDITVRWAKTKPSTLSVCADATIYNGIFDYDVVVTLQNKAIKNKNVYVLQKCIGKICQNYGQDKRLKHLLIDGIEGATNLKDTNWIVESWFEQGTKKFLESTSRREAKVILRNLILSKNIDFHAESVLAILSGLYPKLIIDFFKMRVQKAIESGTKDDAEFEPVPFELTELSKGICKKANVAIPEIIKWCRNRHWRHQWESSHLIGKIFPASHPALENELIKMMKNGKISAAGTILQILDAYEGEQFLHPICKEFVKKFWAKKDLIHRLFLKLSRTGTVEGEYGFVKAYEKKKEEIQSWKTDTNSSVRKFAVEYEKFLEKQITDEKTRADEELQLDKRMIH
ncbi:MAG: DUF4365 domain-containing protein [Sedimentisphaerales bacterium]